MSFESILTTLNNLTSGDRVGICAHTRPDGDAVGSTLALAGVLRAAGIEVFPLLADEHTAPSTYTWLEGHDTYLMPSQAPASLDYLFILDTPALKRLGAGEVYLRRGAKVIVIDHHPRADIPADQLLIDTTASATAQIIWRLIRASRYDVTRACAEACMVGLMTDTGSFNHSNTTPDALRDGADMVEEGARMARIANALFYEKTPAALALEQRVLERLRVIENGSIAYSWICDDDFTETGALRSEAEHIVDIVRSVAGISVAILFTRGESSTRISLRSKTGFDVAAIASEFGGGGHKAAAGATWPNAIDPIETVLDAVVARIIAQPTFQLSHE